MQVSSPLRDCQTELFVFKSISQFFNIEANADILLHMCVFAAPSSQLSNTCAAGQLHAVQDSLRCSKMANCLSVYFILRHREQYGGSTRPVQASRSFLTLATINHATILPRRRLRRLRVGPSSGINSLHIHKHNGRFIRVNLGSSRVLLRNIIHSSKETKLLHSNG